MLKKMDIFGRCDLLNGDTKNKLTKKKNDFGLLTKGWVSFPKSIKIT